MLLFIDILIILLKIILNINEILIGQIKNVSLNVPSWSVRLFDFPILNGTCEECLCIIMRNLNKTGSLNCFVNNQNCQLFSEKRFYHFWFNNDFNSHFYFLEQPTSRIFYFNEIDLFFLLYKC